MNFGGKVHIPGVSSHTRTLSLPTAHPGFLAPPLGEARSGLPCPGCTLQVLSGYAFSRPLLAHICPRPGPPWWILSSSRQGSSFGPFALLSSSLQVMYLCQRQPLQLFSLWHFSSSFFSSFFAPYFLPEKVSSRLPLAKILLPSQYLCPAPIQPSDPNLVVTSSRKSSLIFLRSSSHSNPGFPSIIFFIIFATLAILHIRFLDLCLCPPVSVSSIEAETMLFSFFFFSSLFLALGSQLSRVLAV